MPPPLLETVWDGGELLPPRPSAPWPWEDQSWEMDGLWAIGHPGQSARQERVRQIVGQQIKCRVCGRPFRHISGRGHARVCKACERTR